MWFLLTKQQNFVILNCRIGREITCPISLFFRDSKNEQTNKKGLRHQLIVSCKINTTILDSEPGTLECCRGRTGSSFENIPKVSNSTLRRTYLPPYQDGRSTRFRQEITELPTLSQLTLRLETQVGIRQSYRRPQMSLFLVSEKVPKYRVFIECVHLRQDHHFLLKNFVKINFCQLKWTRLFTITD